MTENKNSDGKNKGIRDKLNRREVLNLAWLASLGILVINIGGVTVVFSYPRFKEGEFGGVFTFGKISDLPKIDAPPINITKLKLWLVNTKQGVLALFKVCTHLGCLYGWNDQEFKFICPCHGSQFDNDGDYISGPAPRSLDQFAIQIIDPISGDELASTSEQGGALKLPDNPDAIVLIDTGKIHLGKKHI